MDRVRKAYFIGEAAALFEEDLGDAVETAMCENLKEAVTLAAEDAARNAAGGDVKAPVVLLSPACASHDQFRNFEARGRAFRDAVAALEPTPSANGSTIDGSAKKGAAA